MNTTATSRLELENGETVALSAIEIATIPDLSIIGADPSKNAAAQKDHNVEYKTDFANLLAEVFQGYKLLCAAEGTNKDVSLEILWLTHPVENQSYAADIRIFFVLRAIDSDVARLDRILHDMRSPKSKAELCMDTRKSGWLTVIL